MEETAEELERNIAADYNKLRDINHDALIILVSAMQLFLHHQGIMGRWEAARGVYVKATQAGLQGAGIDVPDSVFDVKG